MRDPLSQSKALSIAVVEASYTYVTNNAVRRVDPFGLYQYPPKEDGDSCTQENQECLDKFISALKDRLEKAIKDEEDCFTPRGRVRSPADKMQSSKAKECNKVLARCLVNTLKSDIEIRCPIDENMGRAGGDCVASKAKAVPSTHIKNPDGIGTGVTGVDCPHAADPTCKACSPEILANSYIKIPMRAIPDGSNCDPSIVTLKNKNLFHTLMHELLHHCVGPHLESDHFCELGRCDAKNLTSFFSKNCGG
jgi:hypothetical protein